MFYEARLCFARPCPAPRITTNPNRPSPTTTAGVLIDVTVLDRDGRPILDMRPEEFELSEDGSSTADSSPRRCARARAADPVTPNGQPRYRPGRPPRPWQSGRTIATGSNRHRDPVRSTVVGSAPTGAQGGAGLRGDPGAALPTMRGCFSQISR